MNNIKFGDLLFYKGKSSLISKLICKLSNGQYSHVAMFINKYHIIEADKYNLASIKHINYNRSDYDIYRVSDLTNEQIIKMQKYINTILNSKYDWLFIFSRFINKLFKTKIYNYKYEFNCDELIYNIFLYVGINLINNINDLSPNTLSKSNYLIKLDSK